MQTHRHQSPLTLPIAHLTAEEGFPSGSAVKNPLAMQNMQGFHPWVGKILLEKEMATHSVFLPGESLQSMRPQRVGHD